MAVFWSLGGNSHFCLKATVVRSHSRSAASPQFHLNSRELDCMPSSGQCRQQRSSTSSVLCLRFSRTWAANCARTRVVFDVRGQRIRLADASRRCTSECAASHPTARERCPPIRTLPCICGARAVVHPCRAGLLYGRQRRGIDKSSACRHSAASSPLASDLLGALVVQWRLAQRQHVVLAPRSEEAALTTPALRQARS